MPKTTLPSHSPNYKKLDKEKLRGIDIAHIKQLKVNGVLANTMGNEKAVLATMPNNSFYFHVVAPVIWQIRWDERQDGWRIYWQVGGNWHIHQDVFYDLNETYLRIMRLQIMRSLRAIKKNELYYDDMDIETEWLRHTGIQAGFTQEEQEKMIRGLANAKGLAKKGIERKMARIHNRKEWAAKRGHRETERAEKYRVTTFINDLIAIEDEIEAAERVKVKPRKLSNEVKRLIKSGKCIPCKVPAFLTKGSRRVKTKIGDIYIERHPEAEAFLKLLLDNNIDG